MSQVKDPVKSQLLALISKHDTVGAWRLCMSSLKMDFPTCKGIVSIMSGDKSRLKQRENGHEDRTSSAADWRRD